MKVLEVTVPMSGSPHDTLVRVRRTRGFTMVEIAIVLTIFLIVCGIGFMTLQPAWRSVRVNNAYNLTLMTLKQARQWAIANRKTYRVTFNPTGTPANTGRITVERMDAGTVGPVVRQVDLPPDIQFQTITGIPNTSSTTPDKMGIGGMAIEFDIGVTGGVNNQIYFYPDGSARDINNNINNGVVYLARSGELYSSRAITLFGAAGRVRGWRLETVPPGQPAWSPQ
ncbi:MAG TPA: prepilin-type N-terminal cleavage/methylation domain-containing protein [Terriglobales bacterium]|jgi:prepilin-type N-terminal cleavage/methylation domain-containing protein